MINTKALLSGITRQIKVHGKDIQILITPTQFRDTLLKLSSGVQFRSRISSLYVGNNENEQQIISNLVASVKQNESDVSVIIDRYRGLRDGGLVFKDLRKVSPIYLYQTPFISRFGYKKPSPFGEFLGVHHIKYYLFDDTVIISGANLSDLYFGPRQDRYMVIKSKPFADYICYVHQLHATSAKLWDPSYYTKSHWSSETLQVAKTMTETFSSNTPIDNNETRDLGPRDGDTFIYPLFQVPWFSVRQIDDTIDLLLSRATSKDTFTCSSGYFNPTSRMLESLKQTKAQVNIIIPSVEANGFYKGSFIKGFIPDMYNLSAVRTLRKCPNVNIVEYSKDNWSYHAKGWWFNDLTIIGSSNFNQRSSVRDTEFCIAMITECKQLLESLEDEKNRLILSSSVLKNTYRTIASFTLPLMSNFL